MEKSEEDIINEIENSYSDSRRAFLDQMIISGRDEQYIKGRLEWFDEMYRTSEEETKKLFDTFGNEGCDI